MFDPKRYWKSRDDYVFQDPLNTRMAEMAMFEQMQQEARAAQG